MEENTKFTETLLNLKISFTETNNQLRRQAEDRLKELRKLNLILEADILDHISILLQLFQMSNLERNIQISLAVYLKNLIHAKLVNKDLDKDTVIGILRTYVSIYLTGTLSDQVIQNLNIQLQDLLGTIYVASDMNIVYQLLDYLYNQLISNNQNLAIYKPICYILQIIISCSCATSQNIYDILSKEIVTIDYMLNILKQLIHSSDDNVVINT
jgi:hypothetical protein